MPPGAAKSCYTSLIPQIPESFSAEARHWTSPGTTKLFCKNQVPQVPHVPWQFSAQAKLPGTRTKLPLPSQFFESKIFQESWFSHWLFHKLIRKMKMTQTSQCLLLRALAFFWVNSFSEYNMRCIFWFRYNMFSSNKEVFHVFSTPQVHVSFKVWKSQKLTFWEIKIL